MGSLTVSGQVVNKDRPDLVITPDDDPASQPRQSTIDVNGPINDPLPNGVKVALLIRGTQRVQTFKIKKPGGGVTTPAAVNDPTDNRQLRAWHHTSDKQQWAVFKIEGGEVPSFPFKTQFMLQPKPKEPQDVLWVVVNFNEGFGVEHRLYGWTEYPKPIVMAAKRSTSSGKKSPKDAGRKAGKKTPKRRR